MKHVLEFQMPEEEEELRLAMNGHKYERILDEFSNWLRTKIKYENVETLNAEEVREKLREIRIEILSD